MHSTKQMSPKRPAMFRDCPVLPSWSVILLSQQKASSQNPNHLKQIARNTCAAERMRKAFQAQCNAQRMQLLRRKFHDLQAGGGGWGAPLKGEGREGVGWGQCLKRTVSLRFQKQWWPRCWTVGQSPRALPSQPPWPPLAKLVTAVDTRTTTRHT
jgi:hypothetical protein